MLGGDFYMVTPFSEREVLVLIAGGEMPGDAAAADVALEKKVIRGWAVLRQAVLFEGWLSPHFRPLVLRPFGLSWSPDGADAL